MTSQLYAEVARVRAVELARDASRSRILDAPPTGRERARTVRWARLRRIRLELARVRPFAPHTT